jgi:predicted peptidase
VASWDMDERHLLVSILYLTTLVPSQAPTIMAQQVSTPPTVGAFDTTVVQRVTARYRLYLPPGYARGAKRWPLVLFLHGAGERGTDLTALSRTGLTKLAGTRTLPFILVAPQVPEDEIWSTVALAALLERLTRDLPVDPDRVYLTGLSMGAFGAWELATAYPDRFAAVVLISGGGNPVPACRLRSVPVWLVHGRKDDVIPVEESELLARRLEACGGRVRLTVYPDVGHDAWSQTYEDPGFLNWLLAQRRQAPRR